MAVTRLPAGIPIRACRGIAAVRRPRLAAALSAALMLPMLIEITARDPGTSYAIHVGYMLHRAVVQDASGAYSKIWLDLRGGRI
jgi:hypothetical protein